MATGSQNLDVLRSMILTFRTYELQLLLGFAGQNKNGNKSELQSRALQLVHLVPLHSKIRELYKVSQESQQLSSGTMNGQPMNSYSGLNYGGMPMMNLGGPYAQSAQQGRNLYQAQVPQQANPHMYNPSPYQMQPARTSAPVHPEVKIVKLPFYDVQAELLKPASLNPQGSNRFQEAQFHFFLSPSQATDIASNRDIQAGSQIDYLYQIQLRFCPLSVEPNKEVSDEFPPNVNLMVNGKQVPLPNPIPSTKPGVEPKRPPRPVNITSFCKLSPILPNNVNVKWATEYGKAWICGIWMVMKCTSTDLLERLKKRGQREPDFTRKLIIEKLNDTDLEVATTSQKVSLLCPLGKMRMKVPCRPITCEHLQCFDANTFLQMNEKKSTWTCPVCNSKALYDTLLIDGYFQEIIESKTLPCDENEIILERDGTWNPVPKEDDKPKAGTSSGGARSNSAENGDDGDVAVIDLSDDEDIPLPPGQPRHSLPPLPPPIPTGAPPPPPPPPAEIECIDLD